MHIKVCLCFVIGFAIALLVIAEDDHRVKVYKRLIPADTLRDYPGKCFSFLTCSSIEPNKTWDLKPFCGKSTCILTKDDKLMEGVEDCGPPPLPTPKCELDKEKTDEKAEFPKCCPVFKCENGAKPAFPEIAPKV